MNKLLLIIFCLSLCSCYRVEDKIEPKIGYFIQDKHIKSLPSPFAPLSDEEKREGWGQEYLIGLAFAKELDLYRAVTAFKRAHILIPSLLSDRKQEIEYNMLLCYYLAQKFDDVIETYANSSLSQADSSFPPYADLQIILYESCKETRNFQKAQQILRRIEQGDPLPAKKLMLGTALQKGNLDDIKAITFPIPTLAKAQPLFQKISYTSEAKSQMNYQKNPSVDEFLAAYKKQKKSVAGAQALNIIPGAGYLYVGQRQSALTAFLFNGLFVAASVLFFQNGNIPAGIITTSLEMGWYFGGIYGAGEAARVYNERLYEANAFMLMQKEQLSPALMLQYAF